MFLYTQPPKEIKFYPCKTGVYSARGGIILKNKEQRELPQLQFYRFDFFLKLEGSIITSAAFHLDQLTNLAVEGGEAESLSWKEERQEAIEMVQSCIETNGEMDIGEFSHAINYWFPTVDISLEDIKDIKELKQGFSCALGNIFVVRHYFETEWVILTQPDKIRIDFKDVYKF